MKPAQFFHAHAGYSWQPEKETQAQGRRRCARALAAAELAGREAGLSFMWSIDPHTDSSDWSDERPAWRVWQCVCIDQANRVRASLHGIDFGRDGEPHGDPYARVVEAELAHEALPSRTH
jgi:hypothetical protein